MFAQEGVMEIMEDSKSFEILRNAFEQQLINDGFVEHSGYSLEKNHINAYIDERVECAWFACLQGYRLAKAQAVPEWISVKDKLPGFNQSVLSCDGFETCVAEYLESCKNEYGVFFEEGFWINGAASIFENVTHWMPLPEAIEAQEQSDV